MRLKMHKKKMNSKKAAIKKVRTSQERMDVVTKVSQIRQKIAKHQFLLNSCTYKALTLINALSNFSNVTFGENTITDGSYRTRKKHEFESFRLAILTKINDLQRAIKAQETQRTVTRSLRSMHPVTFELLTDQLKEQYTQAVNASTLKAGSPELYDEAINKLAKIYQLCKSATQEIQRFTATEINATTHHRRAENYLTALSLQLKTLQKNLENSIVQFNQFLKQVSPNNENPPVYKDKSIAGQKSIDDFVVSGNIPEKQNFPKSMPTPQRAVVNQTTPAKPSPLRDITNVPTQLHSEEITTDEDSRSSVSLLFSESNSSESTYALSRNISGQAFFMTARQWLQIADNEQQSLANQDFGSAATSA